MERFNLTNYRYFKPKNDLIGFFGTNHMFLLDSPKDYYLSPNTVYQIISKIKEKSYLGEYYPVQEQYKILDLKTMEEHILMIHKNHKLKDIEKFLDLYE